MRAGFLEQLVEDYYNKFDRLNRAAAGTFTTWDDRRNEPIGGYATSSEILRIAGIGRVRPRNFLETILNPFSKYAVVEMEGEADRQLYWKLARELGQELKPAKRGGKFEVGETKSRGIGDFFKSYLTIVPGKGKNSHDARIYGEKDYFGEYRVEAGAIAMLLGYASLKERER